LRNLGVLVTVVAALMVVGTVEHQAESHTLKSSPYSTRLVHQIHHARRATWNCQVRLGRTKTRASVVPLHARSVGFRRWALRDKWVPLAAGCSRELRRVIAARNALTPSAAQQAICDVWGRWCREAIAVARCETGGTFSVYAQNGQYLGLFQMGDWARSVYGHSYTPWGQARAAYRNFLDNGWGQWECASIVGII
jgi:hypothetical protein